MAPECSEHLFENIHDLIKAVRLDIRRDVVRSAIRLDDLSETAGAEMRGRALRLDSYFARAYENPRARTCGLLVHNTTTGGRRSYAITAHNLREVDDPLIREALSWSGGRSLLYQSVVSDRFSYLDWLHEVTSPRSVWTHRPVGGVDELLAEATKLIHAGYLVHTVFLDDKGTNVCLRFFGKNEYSECHYIYLSAQGMLGRADEEFKEKHSPPQNWIIDALSVGGNSPVNSTRRDSPFLRTHTITLDSGPLEVRADDVLG